VVILLTDGRANITRDGKPGRLQAAEEALFAARRLRAPGITALLVDTSPKPEPIARTLADGMGARYLPLPYAEAASLSHVVRAATTAKGTGRE
jgi:magnesium chelatase subunit D